MTTYYKFMKYFKGVSLKKNEDYLSLHEVSTMVHNPPKTMDVNSPLNTLSLKPPVTSRDNPPYLDCIRKVENMLIV